MQEGLEAAGRAGPPVEGSRDLNLFSEAIGNIVPVVK